MSRLTMSEMMLSDVTWRNTLEGQTTSQAARPERFSREAAKRFLGLCLAAPERPWNAPRDLPAPSGITRFSHPQSTQESNCDRQPDTRSPVEVVLEPDMAFLMTC